MIPRLAEDHQNARRLAENLSRVPGILLDPEQFQTNIIYFELDPRISLAEFLAGLARRNIKIGAVGGQRFRAVTHYGIEAKDTDEVATAIHQLMAELS
jgi:threonine aldolase